VPTIFLVKDKNLGAFSVQAPKTGLCGGSGRKSVLRIYFWSFATQNSMLVSKHGFDGMGRLPTVNKLRDSIWTPLTLMWYLRSEMSKYIGQR
jgi:hypothetical protein